MKFNPESLRAKVLDNISHTPEHPEDIWNKLKIPTDYYPAFFAILKSLEDSGLIIREPLPCNCSRVLTIRRL